MSSSPRIARTRALRSRIRQPRRPQPARRRAPRRCGRGSGGRRSCPATLGARRAPVARAIVREGVTAPARSAAPLAHDARALASARARQPPRTFALLGVEAQRGARRGRRPPRPAVVHDRRPPRRRGARVARAGALRASQLRLRVPAAADHRQPRAGRPAEGRPGLRPGDRRRRCWPPTEQLPPARLDGLGLAGELALDGSVRRGPGRAARWPRRARAARPRADRGRRATTRPRRRSAGWPAERSAGRCASRSFGPRVGRS